MIEPRIFTDAAQAAGYTFFAGVPCSYLQPLTNHLLSGSELPYIGATNEGDAVAIAAGATLGGRPAVAMFQNSGLGNAVNAITSLLRIFEIPLLLITTLRGDPEDRPDEPQHAVMGPITTGLLDLIGVSWEYLPRSPEKVTESLRRATDKASQGLSHAFVMRRGDVSPTPLTRAAEPPPLPPRGCPPAPDWQRPSRTAVLRAIREAAGPEDILVATTGFTGRALYALGDTPNQFYMVGSMGSASSLGLGLALARPDRRVIVLDGDGAVLMRMGNLASVGHERPPNLLHVLLDNEAHESTGGQATVSPSADLGAVAAACGYPSVARAATASEAGEQAASWTAGLRMIHVKTSLEKPDNLPRPTVRPPEVARRLRQFLRVE